MARATTKKKNGNILENGFERTREAWSQLGEDFEELQKRAEKRRKELEKRTEKQIKKIRTELKKNSWFKQAEKRRKELEKRAEKFRKDVEKSAPYQRAEEIRADATNAIEEQVDTLLENLRIASQSEISKLERKVNGLQRKVRELEKTRGKAA
ncbi:MAG: hypothetical protein CL910_16390 [Deltaproteobacteria bacterium]|jgi:hypothetical protein|nr:hypothetical protein [Deltaproteobacteria bacterium]